MNSVISNAQPHMPFEVDPQRKILKYISAILNGLFFDMVIYSCYHCCCCCFFLESVAPNGRKKKLITSGPCCSFLSKLEY